MQTQKHRPQQSHLEVDTEFVASSYNHTVTTKRSSHSSFDVFGSSSFQLDMTKSTTNLTSALVIAQNTTATNVEANIRRNHVMPIQLEIHHHTLTPHQANNIPPPFIQMRNNKFTRSQDLKTHKCKQITTRKCDQATDVIDHGTCNVFRKSATPHP